MMDEQLRELLEQIDPMPVDESPDTTHYRTLLETIMSTPFDTEPITQRLRRGGSDSSCAGLMIEIGSVERRRPDGSNAGFAARAGAA